MNPAPNLLNLNDDEVRVDEAQELNGKALDAVLWLVSSYEDGQISYESVSIGLQVLFKSTSGFILPETREVIEAATRAKRVGREGVVVMSRTADDVTNLVQLQWVVGEGSVKVLALKVQSGQTDPAKVTSQVKTFYDLASPAAAARGFLNKTIDTLAKRGYSELLS